jgi:hypothetical protein
MDGKTNDLKVYYEHYGDIERGFAVSFTFYFKPFPFSCNRCFILIQIFIFFHSLLFRKGCTHRMVQQKLLLVAFRDHVPSHQQVLETFRRDGSVIMGQILLSR